METGNISSPERCAQGIPSRPLKTAYVIQLLTLLAAWLPAVAQAQFSYTANDSTITITGYTGSDGDISIPETINGLPVTSIGTWAFTEATNLTSVTIPSSVTSIGDQAFIGCSRLTSIAIPSSVTRIGGYGFSSCTSLTNLSLGSGINSIGYFAFSHCDRLTSLTIPNSVTSIETGAFADCPSLTGVSIPSSVTSIGTSAFSRCSSLTAITVDADNSAFVSVDGILFNKSRTILHQYPGGKAGGHTIPSGVTTIWGYAFSGCTGVTVIGIPTGVTAIGDRALQGCTSLTNITIPGSVTRIESGAFENCTNLTDITILSGIGRIGDWAFTGCSHLTSVTIPGSVTIIGNHAFYGCSSLTAIMVDPGNLLYSSGNGVLFNKGGTKLLQCPGGKTGSYTVPDGVISVGDYSFYGCISLTSITIAATVTNVGVGVFFDCTSLTAISVDVGNPAYASDDGVLFDKGRAKLIRCPEGKTGSYTIRGSVTTIERDAFFKCASLTSVTVPGSITSIGEGAFLACTSLDRVYFQGNAPREELSVFEASAATIYYLPGTTGWGPTFGDRPTALWLPQVSAGDAGFGVRTNQFGFNINWASGRTVVVEACEDLANPVWTPVGTNTLAEDSSYFSDPQWTNSPARFYRLRSP